MSQIVIPTIKAKTLLQTVRYGSKWFGIEYNMNLYRGCNHGCIYCDSRSNCYRIDHFDQVRVKENALHILDRELSYKRKGIVSLGAMSDSYNPYEKQMKITRNALELIASHGFGLSLETKSSLIIRDIDVFQKIDHHHNLILKVTITTADDELSRKIEPHVCVSSERFQAVKELSDAGLFVGILFTPWLPFLTDTKENVIALVQKAKASGAKFIYPGYGVTLRDNQRDYYYEQLDTLFPELRSQYEQRYRDRYNCQTPNKDVIKLFQRECEKNGLLYKMQDIIQAYKKPRGFQQESLF